MSKGEKDRVEVQSTGFGVHQTQVSALEPPLTAFIIPETLEMLFNLIFLEWRK